MKIGINGTGLVQKADVAKVREHLLQSEQDGFSSYWLAEHPVGGFDALTVLAAAGAGTAGIEVGTAIIPTWPRHPMALAGQTLTTAELVGGPLTLGIGLSHEPMMAQLGIGFDKPIRHLREYLSILMPLLRDGEVDYQGETLSAKARLFQKPAIQVQVLVAALGPQALAVTGRLADGTSLAWVGPRTIAEHIVPRLSEAAAAAGRPAPRVLATLPVCVTDNADAVKSALGKGMSMYGALPSYRAMFDREGVDGPADVAIVGSASEVEDRIGTLREAGVTDFAPSEFALAAEDFVATRKLLRTL